MEAWSCVSRAKGIHVTAGINGLYQVPALLLSRVPGPRGCEGVLRNWGRDVVMVAPGVWLWGCCVGEMVKLLQESLEDIGRVQAQDPTRACQC